MPIRRYERREPTHNWNEIRPRLKDPTQVHYEIVRPVILFGRHPKNGLLKQVLSDNYFYRWMRIIKLTTITQSMAAQSVPCSTLISRSLRFCLDIRVLVWWRKTAPLIRQKNSLIGPDEVFFSHHAAAQSKLRLRSPPLLSDATS